MTNLDRMKENIIDQIKNMNTEQFEQFAVHLQECETIPLDISDIRFCDICRKEYASCPENDCLSLCSQRFSEYANRQVTDGINI